jgi:Flagellar assembly protein FliH
MDRALQQHGTVWTRSIPFADRVTNAVLARPDAPLPPFRRPLPPPAPPAAPAALEPDLTKEFRADRARIVAVMDQLRVATDELRSQRSEKLDELRQLAVELALTIASRLFHREVTADDYPIEQIAREMSAQLVDEEPIRVRLNPDDLALLTRRLDGQTLLPTADPKLVADPTLARGSVAVEGHSQLLVADPIRTIQEIRDELLRSITHARS